MTQYTHRITLAVPAMLITPANHLAWIMGESAADAGTFNAANWQDALGNKYAVCSAVAKPSVLNPLSNGLPEEPPSHAQTVDMEMAQLALDLIVIYEPESETYPSDKIVLAIDYEPLLVFSDLGLSLVEADV